MKQRLIITDNEYDVNGWLDKGWTIVSITAQHVSIGTISAEIVGKFAILLERQ